MKWLFFLGCSQVALLLNTLPGSQGSDTADQVIQDLINATANIHTLSYDIENCERIEGELKCGSQKIFVRKSPFQCKIIFTAPKEGDQISYDESKSKNAYYLPSSFPYVGMNLNPMGAQMRKDNHHTIFEVGFDFFSELVMYYYTEKRSTFKVSEADEQHLLVSSSLSDFKYINYTALDDILVRKVARRRMISEQLVYEHAKARRLKKGQTISIPNYYYQKMEILIDKSTHLPERIKVWDDKGLFEDYTFSNIRINPNVDAVLGNNS